VYRLAALCTYTGDIQSKVIFP